VARTVLKFGGTSLGNADRIREVGQIILGCPARGEQPLIVASAHSGVTNMLFDLAKRALAREQVDAEPVRARHASIAHELGLEIPGLEGELQRLEELLQGIRMLGELSPRSLDHVASFGERLSTRVLAAQLRSLGLNAKAYRAWDLGLLTTQRFGQARPLPDSAKRIAATLGDILDQGIIPVITGYIAQSEEGAITTLGRNGSDYSAAIFAAAVDAQEIQIWTDVPGILTTDPRVVPGARLIKGMSFAEASELANYGAKVIHPATLLPAVQKDIPIRVKSTRQPDGSGSLIVPTSRRTEEVVKAIAHKTGITVVHVHSTRMLGRPGFLAKIAKVFKNHKLDVDMIATSEVSVSLTVELDSGLQRAVESLERFAKVRVEHDRAIICVVGEGLAESPATLAQVFTAVARVGTAIDLISQGASRLNLGLVVAADTVEALVQSLHDTLFPSAHRAEKTQA